jgi:hypothetical protein
MRGGGRWISLPMIAIKMMNDAWCFRVTSGAAGDLHGNGH